MGRHLYVRTTLWALVLILALALGFGLQRWSKPAPQSVMAKLASEETTIPARVPDFVLTDSNNQPRSDSEWAGRSLIVNFWATWCPPCLREIPLLKTIQTERAREGFQVIGIAVDRREDVLAYMKKAGIEYPILIGEQESIEVAAKFGVDAIALPFTVFTDRQGRIVTVQIGELHAKETRTVLDAIQSVNEGRMTLEQAQAEIRKN